MTMKSKLLLLLLAALLGAAPLASAQTTITKYTPAHFGSSTAMTCTLASLATSTAGVGRQTTLIDNTSNLFKRIHVYWKITTGTSPTVNKGIYLYLIKADKVSSANTITDGGGASDAAITIVSAQQVAGTVTSATSNQAYQGDFVINAPGPCWGLAIVHDTAVNLNSTGGNHLIYYVGEN